jgi:hypothetical protein
MHFGVVGKISFQVYGSAHWSFLAGEIVADTISTSRLYDWK